MSYPLSVFVEVFCRRKEGSLLGGDPWQVSLQRESLLAIRFCLSHFLGTIATQTLTGRWLVVNRSFASVRSVCAIRSSAMADGGNKLMTRVTTGLRLARYRDISPVAKKGNPYLPSTLAQFAQHVSHAER